MELLPLPAGKSRTWYVSWKIWSVNNVAPLELNDEYLAFGKKLARTHGNFVGGIFCCRHGQGGWQTIMLGILHCEFEARRSEVADEIPSSDDAMRVLAGLELETRWTCLKPNLQASLLTRYFLWETRNNHNLSLGLFICQSRVTLLNSHLSSSAFVGLELHPMNTREV